MEMVAKRQLRAEAKAAAETARVAKKEAKIAAKAAAKAAAKKIKEDAKAAAAAAKVAAAAARAEEKAAMATHASSSSEGLSLAALAALPVLAPAPASAPSHFLLPRVSKARPAVPPLLLKPNQVQLKPRCRLKPCKAGVFGPSAFLARMKQVAKRRSAAKKQAKERKALETAAAQRQLPTVPDSDEDYDEAERGLMGGGWRCEAQRAEAEQRLKARLRAKKVQRFMFPAQPPEQPKRRPKARPRRVSTGAVTASPGLQGLVEEVHATGRGSNEFGYESVLRFD